MVPFESSARNILTVTKLNRLARTVLEGEIGLIWLSAEVSNFVAASSGHWYFTLKDNKAQVRAAMFKGANRSVRVRPKEGDRILVRASVGLYEPRGDYQLIVEHMESDGEGQLKLAFDALKRTLQDEGLFDTARKQPLPPVIRRVGVITSASGAALHDILTVFKRRSPSTSVVIYPSMVQGELAPLQLIRAIEHANRRQEVDVILLSRGGGSLEDLWCFNDERLARAIAQSRLPIVSAVGHEVDVTIADFVADLRAPTPSAGAELLSRDQSALEEQVQNLHTRLIRSWRNTAQFHAHRHADLHHKLNRVHPANRIATQSQTLDRMTLSLTHGMRQLLNARVSAHERQKNRLYQHSPVSRIASQLARSQRLDERLRQSARQFLTNKGYALASSARQLEAVSPLATLSRGYSITFKDGKAVTSVSQVKPGDTLHTRVKDGEIVVDVNEIAPGGGAKQ